MGSAAIVTIELCQPEHAAKALSLVNDPNKEFIRVLSLELRHYRRYPALP